jgi:hypothetical protein
LFGAGSILDQGIVARLLLEARLAIGISNTRPCAGSAAVSLRVLAGVEWHAHAGLGGAVAGVVTSAPARPSAASAWTPWR